MSLRRKLLLLFLGFAILPISVSAATVVVGAFRFAEREARAELERSLHALFQVITLELESERRTMAKVVRDQARSASVGGSPLFMGQALLASRVHPQFFILRRASSTAKRYTPSLVFHGPRLLERDLPVEALPPLYGDLVGAPEAAEEEALVRTAFHSTGSVVAVIGVLPRTDRSPTQYLIAEYSALEYLQDLFSEAAFHELRFEYAAAREADSTTWTVLHHPDPAWIGLRLDPDSDAWPIAAPPDEAVVRGAAESPALDVVREDERLYAAAVHPITGWAVGASVSLAPRLDPLRRTIHTALMLFGLLVTLVVAGILYATRGVGQAVEEIAGTTAAIARGEFDRTIQLNRSDEFGAIAGHINELGCELMISAESRAIARISARLVHDLKGVASQLNLLLYNLRENADDPEFRAESLDLMKGLIDQVEEITLRLRRGGPGGEPRFENVDVDDLVSELLAGPAVRSRPGVRVETELAAGGPVRTDRELLEEALRNVVSNAMEAMPEGGTLRVRTGRVSSASAAAAPPTHFFEVEDSGPGMTDSFIQKELFRPFSTTKEKGIGLGMYSVRQIVDRLGGRVRVESEPGVGTTVRVEVGLEEIPAS